MNALRARRRFVSWAALTTILVSCSTGPALESRVVARNESEPRLRWGVSERFRLTSVDGPSLPVDLDVDPTGRLVVLDAAGPDIWIIDEMGTVTARWPVTSSDTNPFFRPRIVFVSGLSVLVMDPDERLVLSFDLRGRVQGVALDFDADEVAGALGFFRPTDAAADDSGRVFVSDGEGDRVLVFGSGGAFLFAFGEFGTGLGQLRDPGAISVSEEGHVFVCDTGNRRVQQFDGFGSPLAEATIDDPDWVPRALAPTPDGAAIGIGNDGAAFRFRRGRIERLGGTPRGSERVAVGPDGLVYWLSPTAVTALEVEGN
jgi:DNA-binding beta-propeller fold protein YncE